MRRGSTQQEPCESSVVPLRATGDLLKEAAASAGARHDCGVVQLQHHLLPGVYALIYILARCLGTMIELVKTTGGPPRRERDVLAAHHTTPSASTPAGPRQYSQVNAPHSSGLPPHPPHVPYVTVPVTDRASISAATLCPPNTS